MMSQEYADYEIEEYTCGRNKQYALKMKHKKHGIYSTILKLRGITLDQHTNNILSYERFKKMVFDWVKGNDVESVKCGYMSIRRDKRGHVYTENTFKTYKPIYEKRTGSFKLSNISPWL